MQRVILKEPRERVFTRSGDFVARTVIIHAFLYYVMDSPIISDAEYDRMSIFVAKHWDELSEDRQWACGSAEAIRSSGAHIKFSSHAVAAALNYHKYKTGEISAGYSDDVWRTRRDGTRYVKCDVPKPRRV